MLVGMPKITVRQVISTIGVCTAFACFGGNGTSCSADDDLLLTDPELDSLWPCKAAPGEDVVITGSDFFAAQGTGYVRINGTVATVKSWSDTRIVVTVHAGATSGPVTVTNSDGEVSFQSPDLEIGVRTPVPEVEPNDSINGGDATPVGRNEAGTGTLSNVADKDHFRFDCIHKAFYKVKVTPPVVSTVYVDGVGISLDANGEGNFNGSAVTAESVLIGLTGGTGAYSVTVKPLSPP